MHTLQRSRNENNWLLDSKKEVYFKMMSADILRPLGTKVQVNKCIDSSSTSDRTWPLLHIPEHVESELFHGISQPDQTTAQWSPPLPVQGCIPPRVGSYAILQQNRRIALHTMAKHMLSRQLPSDHAEDLEGSDQCSVKKDWILTFVKPVHLLWGNKDNECLCSIQDNDGKIKY